MTKHFLFIILLMFLGSVIHAQKDSLSLVYDESHILPKEIKVSDLETYLSDPKFDYEIIKSSAPEWWISIKNWLSNLVLRFFEWIFGVEKASGAFNIFLEIVPYLLLVVLLFILIKFFITVNARSILFAKNNQSTVALSEEEHIIKNEDIQTLIKGALDNDNYRLAVRYYYLYMLQIMTEKDIIDWAHQKTNEDFLNEIQQTQLIEPFQSITRLYDYVWYGDFPIDKTKYVKAESKFLALKKIVLDA
ncbi:DUF4129 domain-containing protein [Maribacter sp. CXY002]|uniref:DUF4129 domain-containing protein n=1 Tax=Maribacter luteocoastalis TaxID=3407671 RepID=UPI003B6789ED